MGKKKMSLKPVQRGFATTSTASKKPEPAPEPAQKQEEGKDTSTNGTQNSQPEDQKPNIPTFNKQEPDWEDDEAMEKAALQSLVDKLHEKGEKEVARVVKTIEYDRRLATSFPELELDEKVRDEVLELASAENGKIAEDLSTVVPKTIPQSVLGTDTEKSLLRFYIIYHILKKLGFRDERIEQCLLEGLNENDSWEEALEWMWTHLTEDECSQKGEYAVKEEPSLVQPEEPLLELPTSDDTTPLPEVTKPKAPQQASQSSTPPSTAPTSLFQSLDDSPASESDSDDDFDSNKINETWAKLSLELDNLKLAAGGNKGKGKKGKGSSVILETPEMRQLKDKIGKVEKEYLFSRKDADVILKSFKSQRDAVALAARLKGTSTKPNEESKISSDHPSPAPDETSPQTEDIFSGSGDEDEGGLFGGMLDEPAEPQISEEPSTSNTSITVRSMAIPKSSFAGNIPKNILKSAVTKQSKQAVFTYAKLSGWSRAARAGLEIRWSIGRRKVWRMDDIGCNDMAEAENYVSTLALNDLSADGTLSGINWRTMPPDYRELWEELEVKRKEQEDVGKREIWAKIKALYEKKAIEPVAGPKTDVAVKTTSTGTSTPTARGEQGSVDRFSQQLQDDFEKRRSSPSYQKMLQQRNTLPIASFREQIVSALDESQIIVLSGETGCGKSTQLPSFILEDQLSKGKPCKIYVTEPRRISAITLAQRVSQELGDSAGAMGTNSSLVGYSIRLEAKVSPATRLAFVTNGIALRMLESGSTGGSKGTAFDEVTHIIVDEVHERSIESDFLLIVLKNLMQQRKDLKVVLMSATVDAEKISNFFGGCPFLSVPGRTFPVQVNYLEDAVQVTDWHIEEDSPYAVRGRNFKPVGQMVEWNEEGAKSDSDPSDDEDDDVKSRSSNPAKLSSTKYSSNTVSTLNLLDSRQIPYDLIVRLLEKICYEDQNLVPFSQATLVFMPGLAEIRKLTDLLQSHPAFGSNEFVVYPLHSTISSEGQSAVFDIPPKGVRKIVISTNIAETGVTIPDITCVIDSGKHREMRYDEKRQLSRLVETYIARSNAKQRRGRAGRVQEGLAFHLFTKARHDTQLAEHPIPEMLRLSLQDLALRIKILKVPLGKTIESVLLQALDPPSPVNIQRAISSLVEVKALTTNEDITPMGRLLSKLPMDVHLGKFLLVAAMMRCLDPALTIAATLNSKSPFVTPFGFEALAENAKKSFAVGNSDFLTIANVFDSFRRASENPAFVRVFCKKNFVSLQNLQQIEELRQQLLAYLVDSSFVDATPEQRREVSQARFSRGVRTRFVNVPPEFNINGADVNILGGALAAGLYPKLLSLDPSSGGGLKTIINQQPVAIHPSSVNFKVPKSDFGTNYLAYFTIMQSKRLYAWETGPVDDKALALLCGDIADFRIPASSLHLDRKIRYHVSPKTAIAIKLLREQFAAAMSTRLRGKKSTEGQERWFELGMKCLRVAVNEEEARVGLK
ncbi:DEAH box polypeptide 36 [Kwoniella mangroviensis CBS 10435]|uniref:RNA helicase n=1 Tax=Kwoniella mangroviensis CBS 10435 TaxID=1331196 RepID=A0A1B9IZ32_9TREE|nr:DEAH box polypeptide 36 [Kwoniella mangroviensis CBS 10435]